MTSCSFYPTFFYFAPYLNGNKARWAILILANRKVCRFISDLRTRVAIISQIRK